SDKAKIRRLLKTARGQIDGVLKMIDEDKYCVDIVNQIMASGAILRKTAKEVLKAHMNSCVADSFAGGKQKEKDKKINEVMGIIDKMNVI
ncbi:MAG: metal-sensing transcriptional repressor, partial [Endomicrobium sp.]|nr:metal-sensing transcriptional repressor [Endomicrobium sp.]